MGLSLDNALGIHQYSMTLRARRAAILATNIVNADTPNYKARDVDFQAVLKSRMQKADTARRFNGMTSTNDKHMTGSGSLGFASHELFYRVPSQPSLDGNTVAEIIYLSQRILGHARQANWEDLPELIKRRHSMMTSLLSDPSGFTRLASFEGVGDVVDEIHKIQQLNEEIMLLAEDARHDITSNIQSLQRGRKARHLYSETSL